MQTDGIRPTVCVCDGDGGHLATARCVLYCILTVLYDSEPNSVNLMHLFLFVHLWLVTVFVPVRCIACWYIMLWYTMLCAYMCVCVLAI